MSADSITTSPRFDIKAQVIQFRSAKEPFEIAPSMAELRRRVDSVKSWIESGTLSPADKVEAEEWLSFIEQRAELDAETKSAVASLKSSIELSKKTPAQVASLIRENAKTAKWFDEFVIKFLEKRPMYSSEYKVYQEFNAVWSEMIVNQWFSAKIEGNFVLIYDREGNLDKDRTASMARIPDAVSLYQKQMTYLRSFYDTVSKSAKERAMNMVAEYNKQAKAKSLKTLPPLTDKLIADTGAKAIYISDVMNSGLTEPDKAIIIHFLKNPVEAESVFLEAQKAVGAQKQNVDLDEAKRIAPHLEWTSANRDRWMRNPGQFVSEFLSGMGGWIAPAGLYLILNLFGVGHDSLFMKVLLGTTVLGTAKSLWVLDAGADIIAWKNKTVNDAVDWTKKQWDTSSETGIIKWTTSLVWGTVAWAKEMVTRFSAWQGFSNYYADYVVAGATKPLEVMQIPFDYVQSHIIAGTFDAKFKKDQTNLKSKPSEYTEFVKLVSDLDAEGIRNYGEAKWKQVRANRTIAEVNTIAHRKDAVPLGERAAGSSPASAPAVWVAGVVGAAAGAVAGAASSAGEAAQKAAWTVADKAVQVFEWVTGGNEKEINGIKVRNMPKGLTVQTESDNKKVTLKFTPSLRDWENEVKQYTIDDKTKDDYYGKFTLGTLSVTIKVKWGAIEFMDTKDAEAEKGKAEADVKAKAEKAAEWQKWDWTRSKYTKRVLDDVAMVKAWNEKKENKDKWLTVQQYLDFINSEVFQSGITLENAFDFAGPDRRSLSVSSPSNFDTRTFAQVFRKYLFNTMDPLPKGLKETFFNDKGNQPYGKKTLAEFMTK